MKCFFRLLRDEPSYRTGFAPKIHGGVFLLEGHYGEMVAVEELIKDSLRAGDITHISLVVDDRFPNDTRSFLQVLLNENGTRFFLETAYWKIISQPDLIGFKVAIDICGLLVGTENQHKYIELYDTQSIKDVYMRTLIMSVASGYELEDDYDMIKIISLFCPASDLKPMEWLLNTSYTSTSAQTNLIEILSQVYLVRSVYYAQEVHKEYDLDGKKINTLEGESERNSFDFSLYILRCRGFQFDKKKLIALRTRLIPLVLSADKELVKAGFARPRADSVVPAVTLDEDSINKCLIEKGVARYNKIGKILKKTYDFKQSGNESLINYANISNERIISLVTIPNILDNAPSRNVIHPTYTSYSTTGRASCRSPNMTGIPVEGGVRECFTSRDGYTLIIADYDSVEMRVFAQVLLDIVGESQLAEMYQQDLNFDPHSYLASRYLNITYTEAKDLKAKNDEQFKTIRSLMKAVNFGFMGGASHETLAIKMQEDTGESFAVEKALKLKDFYFNTFPEIRQYFSKVRYQIERGGGLTDIYIPRSYRFIGKRNFTQALNNQVQALASDGALDALYEITRQGFNSWSPLYKSRPLLSIHDELIIEVVDAHINKAARLIRDIMIFSMEKRTPKVKASVGVQQGKEWSKKAATLL